MNVTYDKLENKNVKNVLACRVQTIINNGIVHNANHQRSHTHQKLISQFHNYLTYVAKSALPVIKQTVFYS